MCFVFFYLSASPGAVLGSANTFSWYHLPLNENEFVWLPSPSRTPSQPSYIRPTTLFYASSHLLEVVHRSSPALTFPTHLTPDENRQWHPRPFLVSRFPLLPWCSVVPSQHSKKTSCPDSYLTLPFCGIRNMDTYHWNHRIRNLLWHASSR